jgi:hypothetical protein
MLCDADAEEYSSLIQMMPFDVEVENSLSHEDAAERMQKHKVASLVQAWYRLVRLFSHWTLEFLAGTDKDIRNEVNCSQFHVEQLIGYQLLNARWQDATISCTTIGLKMSLWPW